MYILQRVYGFTLQNTPAVLADRLWPRGVSKAKLAGIEWDKAVTPSTDLRKWFHQNPQTRYAEFSQRALPLNEAAHKPTASMARMWSRPLTGWSMPLKKPLSAWPGCARAAVETEEKRSKASSLFMRIPLG